MRLSKKNAPPQDLTVQRFRLSPEQKDVIEMALLTSLEQLLNKSDEWRSKLLGDASRSVGQSVSHLELGDVQERFGHPPSCTAYIVFSNGRSVRIQDIVLDAVVGDSRDKHVKN